MSVLSGILFLAQVVSAQPTPVWSSTLDDDLSITGTGGAIVNPPSTYVPGAFGDAFAGNSSVYGAWDNATVAGIFDGVWNNAAGSTIDLYFSGNHWSTHSGDSGLFAIVDRFGSTSSPPDSYDGFYILSVRDGVLRLPYRNSGNNQTVTFTGPGRLTDNQMYHLTVRQKDTALDVYLNGALYGSVATASTYDFPWFNNGATGGGRQMTVANRSLFGGILQAGEWVDQVSVYNGFYTPAELIPEPTSLALLGLGFGCVALLRRKA